jgi:hypothetical protein
VSAAKLTGSTRTPKNPNSVVKKLSVVELPEITNPRGNLTFIERKRNIPFEIKRVYYLDDVPGRAAPGRHRPDFLRAAREAKQKQ